MDFLDKQNVAGQTLLRLTSRGNAIIAELLRLSAHIPPVFKLEDKQTQKKYGDILFDFQYVGKAEQFEKKIESSNACSCARSFVCVRSGFFFCFVVNFDFFC
jgi:WASH complex subunit strumpellin